MLFMAPGRWAVKRAYAGKPSRRPKGPGEIILLSTLSTFILNNYQKRTGDKRNMERILCMEAFHLSVFMRLKGKGYEERKVFKGLRIRH